MGLNSDQASEAKEPCAPHGDHGIPEVCGSGLRPTDLTPKELFLRGKKPPTAVRLRQCVHLRPSGERATKQTIFIHSWGGKGDTPGQSKSRHWEGDARMAQHSSSPNMV